jgi:hypothetical protein
MKKILTPKTQPSGEQDAPPAPRFQPRGTNKQRILIAVADERIDFGAMSPDSSKRLNDLMHTAEVQKQFGIGPLSDRFDPRHCRRIYEGLGHILMGIGGFVFKWPESANEKFIFTEAEKDELAEPTAAALDEVAPMWLRENQAVSALVVVLGSILQNKMRAAALEARRVALERQERVNVAAGVPPQTTIEIPPLRATQPKPPGRVIEVPPAPAEKSNGGTNFGGTGGKVGA